MGVGDLAPYFQTLSVNLIGLSGLVSMTIRQARWINDEYGAFVKEHIGWIFKNTSYIQSINTPEKPANTWRRILKTDNGDQKES